MAPTTTRFTVDLTWSLWSKHETTWRGYGYQDLWLCLRHLPQGDSIEVNTHPRKEIRSGRVIFTRMPFGHYEAHGTFSTEWDELHSIVDHLDLDRDNAQHVELVASAMVYNAQGAPGTSRDFRFTESTLELIFLAVDHVEELLILQDQYEWAGVEQRVKEANLSWSVTYE